MPKEEKKRAVAAKVGGAGNQVRKFGQKIEGMNSLVNELKLKQAGASGGGGAHDAIKK